MSQYNRATAGQPSRHVPAIAGVLILIGVGIHLFVRQDNEWEKVFVPAAARLQAGDDLYLPGAAYLYPPFTAWATIPFVGLSHAAGRFVFVGINLACVAFVLRAAWHLAGGGRPSTARELWTAILGGSCGIFYIHNCLVHQQTDLFIAALLLGACLALIRGRSILAATGFGIAAAMKCTPLLWAPYLLWRRRPLAAAWLVTVALGVNLLPELVNRPAAGGTWLGVFASRYLAPLTNREHVPGSWGSEIVYNQSLAGAAQRWLMTEPHWTDVDCTIEKTDSKVSPAAVRALLLASEGLLALVAAWILARPFQRAANANCEVLEFSVVMLFMLLLSPMSSMAHFGVLVLPGFCIARRVWNSADRVLMALLLGAIAAALASNKDLLGGRLYTVALWGGCVMLNTLFLLAACLRELARSKTDAIAVAVELRSAA
jgi:hypothetical protein